jgi:L-Ala-D/L-Glu epimerase
MRISRIILYNLKIPLKSEFSHALKARTHSESIIVQVITDTGLHGFGEGTPRDYVNGETIDHTFNKLKDTGTLLKGIVFSEKEGNVCFSKTLTTLNFSGASAARCALELALLDSWGQYRHKPLSTLLAPVTNGRTISYSGIVSSGGLLKTKDQLFANSRFGFRQVKIKVGVEKSLDLKRLIMAREILGPDVEIRVDANGSWELSEAVENIKQLSKIAIASIEQPLAAECREDYPRLMELIDTTRTNIIIDESVCTETDARWFISNKGASGFNLKISKHGGILPTWQIYTTAIKANMTCQLGCHVGETALLSSAGQHFAATAQNLISFEGSFGNYALENDISQEDIRFGKGGEIDLKNKIKQKGLGVQVVDHLLRQYSERIEI